MWPCSEATPDAMAACLATMTAARLQADAAIEDGRATFLAAGLTLGGALIAAAIALQSVWSQNQTARELQKEAHRHAARKDAYMAAASALYSGLIAIGRFGNLKTPETEAFADYQDKVGSVAHVHMVAPIHTIDATLAAVTEISRVHMSLRFERGVMLRVYEGHMIDSDTQIRWSRRCIECINGLGPGLLRMTA